MSIKVKEFAFVGHPVESIQRARKFYEGVLGFPEPVAFGESDIHADIGWLEYNIGPHTLAITTAWSDAKPVEVPSGGLVLEVEDFEAALETLKEHGIEPFLGPFSIPNCSIVVIKDPDGNVIGLHKLHPHGKA